MRFMFLWVLEVTRRRSPQEPLALFRRPGFSTAFLEPNTWGRLAEQRAVASTSPHLSGNRITNQHLDLFYMVSGD